MGAQVQSDNHSLFIVSNKNEQAEFKTINLGDARPACANKMVLKKGQSYSIFKQEMPENCSEYDREILKQTMLRHEEIFREQVHELHRLYKIQKLLMDDLKRKDLNRSTLSSMTKQDGAYLFHFGPEQLKSKEKQNLWGVLNGSLIERDSAGHKYPISATDYIQIPVSGQMEQNLQIASNPKEINGIEKDLNRLQPSRPLRRTFDLERPADEYIDDEATGQIEENAISRTTNNDNGNNSNSFNFYSSQEPENEVQLTLSIGWDKGTKINGRQTGPHMDLGFPKQEKKEMKESNCSRSNEETLHFSVASTRSESATQEIFGNQKSVPSNQSFIGGMLGYGQENQKHEDHRSKWQNLDDEHEKRRKEKQSLDIEAGPEVINGNNLTRGFIWEKSPAAYQTREGKVNGVQGVPLEIHEAWASLFQEQREMSNSWSKQGVFTGTAMQRCISMSAKDTSVGSPIEIPLASLATSLPSVSQQFTENSNGVFQPSALLRKNEDSFSQLTAGVHSKVYTAAPTAVDMPMHSLDSQSSSHEQSFVSNRTNGMDAKGSTTEFNWGKRFPIFNPLQSTGTQLSTSFQSRSLSSLGQDLRQSSFAGGSRSFQQQVASCAMPTPPHLPGFSLNSLPESSGSSECPCPNGMPPFQVYGGRNAQKGSPVSFHVDLKDIKEVDLTLSLSNRVINDAINSASDCFLVADQKNNPCRDDIEKVNRTIKGVDQRSEHTKKGDPEEFAGFTVGLLELPCMKDPERKPVEMIQPNKVMGIYDLLGKPLPADKNIDDDWDANDPSTNKLVHRVVPLSRKKSLVSLLASDSALNDDNELNGKNGVKCGVLPAREGDVENPGNLAKQFFYKQLLSSTDQNCRNKSTHSHTVAQLTGCDISINTAQKGQTSNINGAEPGLSCDGSKQMGEAECQFMLPSPLRQIEIEAPLHTNLNWKTTQCLGLDIKGGSGMLSMHIEMETKSAIDDCEEMVERLLGSQTLHAQIETMPNDDCEEMVERLLGSQTLHAQIETMPNESYFHGKNTDKFTRNGNSSVDTFLQASISDISHSVKPLKGDCVKTCNLLICNQKNLKLCSDGALSHSSPMEVEMVQKEEIENAICIEEADSKLTKCAELLADIDENEMQKDSEPALNFRRHSSCSTPLPELANAVKYVAGDVSESAHLAAETLLRIVSEKNSKHLDIDTCHRQNSPDPKTTLEWFADMIPGDTDHLEFASVRFNEEIGYPFLSRDTVSNKNETGLCEDSIPEKGSSHSSALDFFESMTLLLLESNADEHCKPYVKDHVETENISSSVNYVSRTLKRGKRQRDFQKEILPGISSLSRQKIAQDLQTIGVLMRSMEDVCQTRCTGRNGGTYSSRGDWFMPPKGRRSRCSGVSRASCDNVETNAILRSPKSYNQAIDRLDGMPFKSTWGETTRRKRMQRQRTPMVSSA